MSKPLSLSDLQSRLFGLITARATVPEELEARGLEPAFVTDHLKGDGRLDAVGRLDIYNSMFFFRILEDVLEADYPTVKGVLGEEEFKHLAADYIAACPPAKPSARYASERLPVFLTDWCATHEAPVWLPTLAALEWARVDTFDDVDDEAMTMAQLQGIDPSTLPTVRLATIRAHRAVKSNHGIVDVWRAVEHGESVPTPDEYENTVLVWREDAMVYHRELSDDEARIWPKLQTGMTFGELCEQLGETYPIEEAAQVAVQLLTAWLADGLLLA
jgi:hypothetical protein